MMSWPRVLQGFARLVGLAGLAFAAVVYAQPSPSASGLAPLAAVSPVAACATLAKVDIDADVGAKVALSAQDRTIAGAPYCVVAGVIAPAIRFEVRLPSQGWTQRFLQVGCGGLCGHLDVRVEHDDGCTPARDHQLVLAATDMGHEGETLGDGAFGKDPQARIDFAYRGVHLTAVAAKALIRRFYGQPPRYSYFSGCSDGGREGLMEVERFPADFDGVAAGAPAMNFQVQNTFYHAWMYRSNHDADGRAILLAGKLAILHRAVVAECDALDGVRDGLIGDPRVCHPHLDEALCKSGEPGADCLTPAEIAVARKFYQGPQDAAGHRFTIGGPEPGSELAWAGVYVPKTAEGDVMSRGAALETLKYLAFPDDPPATYTLADFRFDQATFARLSALHPLYDATDTDLSAFQARGGRLILWHGWSDPHISPINTIAFYQAVQKFLGPQKSAAMMRLFLFPGLYHCGGGDGFSDFDVLTPLMAWVESGRAPDLIMAAQPALDLPPMLGRPPPGMGPPDMGPRDMAPPNMAPPDMAPPDMPPPGVAPPGFGPGLGGTPPPAKARRPIFAYPDAPRLAAGADPTDPANWSPAPPSQPEPARYDWEGQGFMAPGFLTPFTVKDGAARPDAG